MCWKRFCDRLDTVVFSRKKGSSGPIIRGRAMLSGAAANLALFSWSATTG